MPVKHDLFMDLDFTREQVTERSKADKKLNQLLSDYSLIDTNVLDAESGAADDDELKKLKERRLLIKDKIVQRLSTPD